MLYAIREITLIGRALLSLTRGKLGKLCMMKKLFAAGVALAAFVAVPAMAQDFNANPTYGTVNLRSGFTPDPHVVNVQSGGSIAASGVSSSCAGFIANAPDVRLNYTAGSLPLIISAASAADTTLVINGPDGSWYCDDDGGAEGMNPSLRFGSPQSGQYDIWIGTYGNASLQAAQLNISEVGTR
jgi:hypothetical protein